MINTFFGSCKSYAIYKIKNIPRFQDIKVNFSDPFSTQHNKLILCKYV